MADSVKIHHGMLTEDGDDIILRGVIDPGSLGLLQVDDYQREILSATKIGEIIEGLKSHGVPDIILGMRGEHYLERGGFVYLQDTVHIIDGLQRVTGAVRWMATDEAAVPQLGVKVHFGTTYEMERDLFDKLNLAQTKLSSNITLRNRRKVSPAIGQLHALSMDRSWVMYDKIAWTQNMRRGDLISAVTFVKVAAMLHSHTGPGRSNTVLELVTGLDKIAKNIGVRRLAKNVRTFFEILDESYGIKRVSIRGGATYLKSSFLMQLARVLSDHPLFWDGEELKLQPADIRKLQTFPIDDPEIMRLSSSSGTAGEILYQLFVKHFNVNRRSRRLEPRRSLRDRPVMDNDSGEDAEENQ